MQMSNRTMFFWNRLEPMNNRLFSSLRPLNSSITNTHMWHRRQAADPYVRARAIDGLRSRAGYKLDQIIDEFPMVAVPGSSVLDLGGAPGGWTQILVKRCIKQESIVDKEKENESINQDMLHISSENIIESNKKIYEEMDEEIDEEMDEDMDEDMDEEIEELEFNEDKDMVYNADSKDTQNINIPNENNEKKIKHITRRNKRYIGQGKVVTVDLLPIIPIKNATVLQGDMTTKESQARIWSQFTGKPEMHYMIYADIAAKGDNVKIYRMIDSVFSDMAHSFSGNPSKDNVTVLSLCELALDVASTPGMLRKGGSLICKYFECAEAPIFRSLRLDPVFRSVVSFKPDASRQTSSESYFICRGFKPRKAQQERRLNRIDWTNVSAKEAQILSLHSNNDSPSSGRRPPSPPAKKSVGGKKMLQKKRKRELNDKNVQEALEDALWL